MKKKIIIILSTVAVIGLCAVGGIALASHTAKEPDMVVENVEATAEVSEEIKHAENSKETAKQELAKVEEKPEVKSEAPAATEAPKAEVTPSPTEASKEVTASVESTAPAVTEAPKETEKPAETETSKTTESVAASKETVKVETESSKKEETSKAETPKATEKPEETAKPKEEPKATEEPKAEATPAPTPAATPEPTPAPTPEPTPVPTEAPCQHNWVGVVAIEPTCTSGGYGYDECTLCGEQQNGHSIDFEDHDFDEKEVRAGDCVSPSVVEITCKNCGYSKREEGSTTDEHDWITANEAPTVDMTTGELIPGKAVTFCNRCGITK